MAQPTLTLVGTDLSTCESLTGWDSPAQLGSDIMNFSVQSEFFVQGSNGLGQAHTASASLEGARYAIGTNTDFTVAGRKLQMYLSVTSIGVINSQANGGVRVYAEDSSGNYGFWYVGGNDVEWCGNGFKLIAVDLNTTPDANGGTNPNPASISHVGYAINYTGGLGKADASAVDMVRYVDYIEITGNTLRFTDGTNGIDLNENGASADSIDRNDGGSWITDGFEAGDIIEVRGATTAANNGRYTIVSLTASTLTLNIGDFTNSNIADTGVEVEAEFTIDDCIAEDELNDTYYGMWRKGDTGIIEQVGNIVIGDVSGALYTSFRSENDKIVIADNNLPVSMQEIAVIEDTGETRFKMGTSSGSGDSEVGFAGSTFLVNSEVYTVTWGMDLSAAITECLVFGSNFEGLGENTFVMSSAATNNRLKSCNFVNCGQIQTGKAVTRKCFFVGTTSADSAVLWDVTNQDIKESQFLANTDTTNNPAGMEHTSAGSYAYVDMIFSGNDYDILNSANATTEDSYSESNQDGTQSLYSGSNTRLAQSIVGAGGVLSSCRFFLKKTGTPTGNITAYLYASTGTPGSGATPTGSALATSQTVDISTLTTSYALVKFEFTGTANQVTLTAATNYFIVVEYTGGSVSNSLDVGVDTTSIEAGTNIALWAGSWTADNTDEACYYVSTGGIVIINATDSVLASSRNTGSPEGIVDIRNAVTITINVIRDDTEAVLQNAQTSIHLLSDGTQLMNEDTNASGVATEAYNYSGDVQAILKVRKSEDTDNPRFRAFSQIITIGSSGYSTTVRMVVNTFV